VAVLPKASRAVTVTLWAAPAVVGFGTRQLGDANADEPPTNGNTLILTVGDDAMVASRCLLSRVVRHNWNKVHRSTQRIPQQRRAEICMDSHLLACTSATKRSR